MHYRISLSDKVIVNLPFAAGEQQIIRDDQLSGFFLVVGARSKSFMIQADLRTGGERHTVRLKVGEAGVVTTREARAKAKMLIGQIAEGIDPRPKKKTAKAATTSPRDPTLRSAWNAYLASHLQRKGRAQKTIDEYRDHVDRLMTDWLGTPLSRLGEEPALVKAKHDELTAMHGPYIANACLRTFRAIYNHARKTGTKMPRENPVFAVDWNPEKRRNSGLGPRHLRDWFEQLEAIENPVRRELHLFLLLSGGRPEATRKIKADHPDFGARLLFIPCPKGGEDKAFCIPLSREMIRCLIRAMRFGRIMHPNAGYAWMFPADSRAGHISTQNERRERLSHWGNDLRQTYRTMGQVAGVGKVDMHLLMNHSMPGVNEGYITREALADNHLRKVQQAISSTIFDNLRSAGYDQSKWPFCPSRQVLDAEIMDQLHKRRDIAASGWSLSRFSGS